MKSIVYFMLFLTPITAHCNCYYDAYLEMGIDDSDFYSHAHARHVLEMIDNEKDNFKRNVIKTKFEMDSRTMIEAYGGYILIWKDRILNERINLENETNQKEIKNIQNRIANLENQLDMWMVNLEKQKMIAEKYLPQMGVEL